MRNLHTLASLLCFVLTAGCGAPTPAELLDDAEQAYAAGQMSTADIHLRNLLVEEPDNVAARALLGRVSLGLGNLPAAEAQLARALELGADAGSLQLPLLQALVGQRKFTEAIARFEAGPELEGAERVTGLMLIGQAQRSLGSTQDAEASYRRALALDPDSAQVRSELAALLLATGRAEEAGGLVAAVLDASPDYIPAILLRAQLERASGQTLVAERTYREVMGLVPGDSVAYVAAQAPLAELLFARGAVTEAAPHIDALFARSPQSPLPRFLMARLEMERDEPEAAERRLEALAADFPGYAPANRLLGVLKADRGQFGQAERHLQNAMANEGVDTSSRLLLAQVYMRQGRVDDARELLAGTFPEADNEAVAYALAARASQELGDIGLAADFFAQSEQAEAQTPGQLFSLANLYVASGELDRAVRVLEAADFDDEEGQSGQAARYMLALVHAAGGDTAAATETAGELVAELPDQAWPRILQGTIAIDAGDHEAARGYLTSALEVEPGNVSALLNLARAEVMLGERGRAREALLAVLEEAPEQAAAVLGLAELAIAEQDFPAAAQWLSQAPEGAARLRLDAALAMAEGRPADGAPLFQALFERQPGTVTAMLAYSAAQRAGLEDPSAVLRSWLETNPSDVQVLFALGSHELQEGNHDEAVRHLEAAVANDPNNAAALNNLAWLYNERGDDRALDTAERAYGAAPQNPAVADTLGWLHVQQGNASAGRPYLEQAAEAAPNAAEIQYHWGVVLAETGDSESAINVFETLLEQNPSFPGRDDAERRLAEMRR